MSIMTDSTSHGKRNAKRGTSLSTTLLVIFIILKLTNIIEWSWLWVLSPLWISAGLGLLFLLVIGLILLVAAIGLLNEGSKAVTEIKRWFRKEGEE